MSFNNSIITASLFIIVFASCKDSKRNSLQWEKTFSDGVEYVIISKRNLIHRGESGIILMPYGKMQNGKIIQDSSCRSFEGFTDRLLQILKKENEINHLGPGSTGFCKVGLFKMIDSLAVFDSMGIGDFLKISIWFPLTFQPKDSTIEIQKLLKYGAFDAVSYIFKGVELKLKEKFLNRKSIDSLTNILHKNYPNAEIKSSKNFQEILPENSETIGDVVFEFTIIGF